MTSPFFCWGQNRRIILFRLSCMCQYPSIHFGSPNTCKHVPSHQTMWSYAELLISLLTLRSFCRTTSQVSLGLLLGTLPTTFIRKILFTQLSILNFFHHSSYGAGFHTTSHTDHISQVTEFINTLPRYILKVNSVGPATSDSPFLHSPTHVHTNPIMSCSLLLISLHLLSTNK